MNVKFKISFKAKNKNVVYVTIDTMGVQYKSFRRYIKYKINGENRCLILICDSGSTFYDSFYNTIFLCGRGSHNYKHRFPISTKNAKIMYKALKEYSNKTF